jgi:hypothetical protein
MKEESENHRDREWKSEETGEGRGALKVPRQFSYKPEKKLRRKKEF